MKEKSPVIYFTAIVGGLGRVSFSSASQISTISYPCMLHAWACSTHTLWRETHTAGKR